MNFQKLLKISVIFLFVFSLIPNIVFAQTLGPGEQAARNLAQGSPISEPNDIFRILAAILKYTYTAFFIVAVLFIIAAAFNFLFARGDPEKIKSARSQVLWASVAIAIGLISGAAHIIINSFLRTPTA